MAKAGCEQKFSAIEHWAASVSAFRLEQCLFRTGLITGVEAMVQLAVQAVQLTSYEGRQIDRTQQRPLLEPAAQNPLPLSNDN